MGQKFGIKNKVHVFFPCIFSKMKFSFDSSWHKFGHTMDFRLIHIFNSSFCPLRCKNHKTSNLIEWVWTKKILTVWCYKATWGFWVLKLCWNADVMTKQATWCLRSQFCRSTYTIYFIYFLYLFSLFLFNSLMWTI